MLLSRQHAADFILTYSNLLHCAGVAHGIVPEGMDVESFMKQGHALLVKCRIALFGDLDLLDEFREDAKGGDAEWFDHMLTAVEHARPTLLYVLRDSAEYTICVDLMDQTFCHVKSLTEPLGAKLGEHVLARVVLMTYRGQVIHDGLVIPEPVEKAFTTSQKKGLEAEYKQALAEDRIMGPWGPGFESLGAEDLTQEAVSATMEHAAMFHPMLVVPFSRIAEISPNEDTFLKLCLDAVQVMRGNPEPELARLATEGTMPDRDQFLFTLDRIEGDVRAVLRRPVSKRASKKSRKAHPRKPVATIGNRAPVTLAERLNAAAPFTATGTRELTQVMREQGTPITLKTLLKVEQVVEGPLEAGITCTMESTGTGVQFLAPLTYLVLPVTSPFYREVEEWRRKRHKIIARLNAGYR